MTTLIVLIIYIVGVYAAYVQLQKWANHRLMDEDEYQALFVFSLFSWLVYPIYGIIWIFRKDEED